MCSSGAARLVDERAETVSAPDRTTSAAADVDERVPWWSGIPFLGAAVAVWAMLAMNVADTTYHFAPMIVAAAWPMARRLRARRRLSVLAIVVTAGGGTVLALITTAALAVAGALTGPTFFGTEGAVGETLIMVGVGSALGLVAGLFPARRGSTE